MSCAARCVRNVVLASGLLVFLGCSSSSPPSGAAPTAAGKTGAAATQQPTPSPPASPSASQTFQAGEPVRTPQGPGGLIIGSGDDDDK